MSDVSVKAVQVNGSIVAQLVREMDWCKDRQEAIRDQLVTILGPTAEAGIIAGTSDVAMTYKPMRSPRFDIVKFREQYPELADQFTRMDTRMVLRPNRKALGLAGADE